VVLESQKSYILLFSDAAMHFIAASEMPALFCQMKINPATDTSAQCLLRCQDICFTPWL
jgi:hypothetical protein